MKMKHNESPAVFMTKLKEVKSWMEDQGGRVIPEEEFLMDILSKLSNAKNRNSNPPYGIARVLIERDMNDPMKIVDYLSVQRELSNRYRQLQNLEGQKQERTEVALSAETSGGGCNSHPGRSQGGRFQ